MSSGQQQVVLNSRERIISDDLNLLQSFVAADRVNGLRRLFNRVTTDRLPVEYPGLQPQLSAVPAATRGTLHDVYGGLMVRPDDGASVTIDPGVAAFFAPAYPDLTVDDSPYVVVQSPGQPTTGILTFTANASGTPRIDVVECRPVPTLVASQLRDVRQPDGTNLATTVPKVRRATLEFRIRVGTPDAGFPAVDQEWLPLAVIVVQSGASNFSQADFYDVRPLVSERVDDYGTFGPVEGATSIFPATTAGFVAARILSRVIGDQGPSGGTGVNGAIGVSHGYRVGGVFYRNTPSSIADFGAAGDAMFDATLAPNRLAAAPSTTAGHLNVLVLAFPMGLPRWVRYSQAAAPASPMIGESAPITGRLPRGTNGILLIGRPAHMTPGSQVTVTGYPSLFGAGAGSGLTDLGVAVGYTVGNGAGQTWVASNGKSHRMPITSTGGSQWTSAATVVSGGVGATSYTVEHTIHTLAPGIIDFSSQAMSVPLNAAKVLVAAEHAVQPTNTDGMLRIRPQRTITGGSNYYGQDGGGVITSLFPGTSSYPFMQYGMLMLPNQSFIADSVLAVANSTWRCNGGIDTPSANVFAGLGVNVGIIGWEESD